MRLLSLLLWLGCLQALAADPVVTLTPAQQIAPDAERAKTIAARIVWGDDIDREEAAWILANREKVAEAIRREMERQPVREDTKVSIRGDIWAEMLDPAKKWDLGASIPNLAIVDSIGQTFVSAGLLKCPYSAETLSELISDETPGKDPRFHRYGLSIASLFDLRACLPAIRKGLATRAPAEVSDFALAAYSLEPSMEDVRLILSRVDQAESLSDKGQLLNALIYWTMPKRTAHEAQAAVEAKILEHPDLQDYAEVAGLWSSVAGSRSLPALWKAVKKRGVDHPLDPLLPAETLWRAIARLTPRDGLVEVFQTYPDGARARCLLLGACITLRENPLPELAPIVYRLSTESKDGIALLPVNSEVIAFLLECCGAAGLEAAAKLANEAENPEFSRAVMWKEKGYTFEIFARELAEAGVLSNGSVTEAKAFAAREERRTSGLFLQSDLALPFLTKKKVAVLVPWQDETMPVEYPEVVNPIGDLDVPELAVVETDQEVDGIEQLAEVNPDTLEVPEKVKLRYRIRVRTARAMIEFQPKDLRDRFDLHAVAGAFNAAAEKLGMTKRFGIVSQEGEKAAVVFGDLPVLEKIFAKYGL